MSSSSLLLLLLPATRILQAFYIKHVFAEAPQPGQRTARGGTAAAEGSTLCQLLQLELFGQMFEERV